MAPRKRLARHRDLPPNLYSQTKGGATYFRYRHPETRKEHGVGKDKAKAIQAAKILNARLSSGPLEVEKIVALVEGKADTLGSFVETFLSDILPTIKHKDGSPLSEKSLVEFRRMYRTINDRLGYLALPDVTRKKVAEFLDSFPHTASNRYRTRLSVLFTHAIAKGLMNDNPVAATIAKPEEVKRRRLTLEAFKAIRANGEKWLQNAMDLSLHTLLRREDVVAVKFADIDGNRLFVVHQKTKRHEAAKIEIELLPAVLRIIERCRDDILSPYIIHRKPIRKRKRAEGDHWTRINVGMVSRAFEEARDSLEEFEAMPKEERPTFHEIRALGRKLYADQGIDVKALGGWSDEKMPEKYLEGHDRWIKAVAGLEIVGT